MTKILVVDDESDLEILLKQKFRKKIRENEYQFIFATNGLHALEQLNKHKDIDIVLSDINMPEMDGLTLLSKLTEQHSILKAVIISAYGDMENIRTAMNKGAFDFITKPVDFTDLEVTLEKTIKQVNQIRTTLRAIKENNILKMYVDETVLIFMDSTQFETSIMSNETIEASVAFIDICDFTTISENKSPDDIVKLLNSYFEVMVNEIIAHGGCIDKFIGDAIMAVFRGEFHQDRAIEASLAVRNKINDLPAVSELVNFKPNVSIGINSGEMVSGNIGSASLRRLDYTVIGDVVNTAQRMQSAAKPGQIVINKNAFNRVKEFFKCQELGEMSFKNKTEKLILYEVLE
jgi:class 3 adenylate cyclase/FixJ family two-component response regulator